MRKAVLAAIWLIFWGLSGLLPQSARGETSRPAVNVVIFLIDDLGRNDLGCYGSKFYRTPNIDQIAADGMKFTDAYASCPVCSPTRAALMTGKWPAQLHLTDWLPGRADRPDQKLARPPLRQQLPLEEVTLAEMLQARGYATGIIGKWHLGGVGFEPTKQGFQINIAGDATGTPLSYFAPFRNKNGVSMPGLEEAPEGEYLTDRLAAEAEKFITNHKDRPFFLYLPHYAVHTPMKAKPEIIAQYPEGGPPKQQGNHVYAAMVQSMDEAVGRVLKKLDEMKLSERTLVLFSSDNGGLAVPEGPNTPATINAPHREAKGWLYEGGIRAPLLVKLPGVIKAGTVSPLPVSTIDFLPTILDLVGGRPEVEVHGQSMANVLRGKEPTNEQNERPLYWHYPHYSNQGGKPGGAIRQGDWKLIEFYENGRRELFNVRADQGESRNQIEAQPKLAAELTEKLTTWRKDVAAQMPTPNPAFVPNPPGANGTVILHARTADVFGVQLRYEPLPHKYTLGFWVRQEDYAQWEFELPAPGKYKVEILQGCGNKSGGSEVNFTFGDQTLKHTVVETGGFQNFQPFTLGEVQLPAGRQKLVVQPKTKPGPAVMDLREVLLKPVK